MRYLRRESFAVGKTGKFQRFLQPSLVQVFTPECPAVILVLLSNWVFLGVRSTPNYTAFRLKM